MANEVIIVIDASPADTATELYPHGGIIMAASPEMWVGRTDNLAWLVVEDADLAARVEAAGGRLSLPYAVPNPDWQSPADEPYLTTCDAAHRIEL